MYLSSKGVPKEESRLQFTSRLSDLCSSSSAEFSSLQKLIPTCYPYEKAKYYSLFPRQRTENWKIKQSTAQHRARYWQPKIMSMLFLPQYFRSVSNTVMNDCLFCLKIFFQRHRTQVTNHPSAVSQLFNGLFHKVGIIKQLIIMDRFIHFKATSDHTTRLIVLTVGLI